LGAAAVYRRRRVQTVEGSVVPRESPAAAPVVPSSLPWLSGLYLGAAELVGRVTGVRIRRSDTVREYLGAVKASLSGSDYGLFSGFSGLYERWFYGGRRAEPSPDEAGGAVEKMRKLVEQNPA